MTCGDQLHPDRATRYDYCTRPECRDLNAKPHEIVAVGVNKAAEQYVALTERTKRELEGGRYKKVPGVPSTTRRRLRRRVRPATPVEPAGSSAGSTRPRWSKAQEELALIYHARGMKPDEIASRLDMSRYLVTQILLAATNRGKP